MYNSTQDYQWQRYILFEGSKVLYHAKIYIFPGSAITFFLLVVLNKYIQTTTCPETCLTCSVCRNHIPVLCSVMPYQQVCNKSKTMGATCGAGTAYPYGWPEFTPVVSGVRFVRSLVFCVLFCRSLFVLFLLAIVLSMLWFMASDYPFGTFWPLNCLSFDLRLLIIEL